MIKSPFRLRKDVLVEEPQINIAEIVALVRAQMKDGVDGKDGKDGKDVDAS